MSFLVQINRLISLPNGIMENKVNICRLVTEFVNEDESGNAVGSANGVDEMRPLLAILRTGAPGEFEVLFARILKILLRRQVNREALGKQGITCVIHSLTRQVTEIGTAATEIGNMLLNAFYHQANVSLFVAEGGLPPLISLLRVSIDHNVLASVLGAMQGVCFTRQGKVAFRSEKEVCNCTLFSCRSSNDNCVKAVLRIVELLNPPMAIGQPATAAAYDIILVVRARAIGTLHNLSTDPVCLPMLVESGCIAPLVKCLRDSQCEVCHSAAGSLQNLARGPPGIREQVLEEEGLLVGLSDLLHSGDVKCQVQCRSLCMVTRIVIEVYV